MQITPRSIAEDPLSYPGPLYPRSFYLEGEELSDWQPDPVALEGRIALLAIGSNRDPARLLCHLKETSHEGLYGLRGQAEGLEIVYPAHVSSYGVCTATVIPGSGSYKSLVHLLTEGQVYELCGGEDLGELFDLYRLGGALFRAEGFSVKCPLAFVHRSGPLMFEDGKPRRLGRACALASSLEQASLKEAHGQIERELDLDLSFPLDDPAPIDRALQGGPLGWYPALGLNRGQRLEKLPEAELLA